MVGKLTGGPGVGIGELATNHNLIRLRSVEVVVGLVELAEEVADVVLGTHIQDPEVGRELHGSVPTEENILKERIMACIPPNPRRVGYIAPIHGPLDGPLYTWAQYTPTVWMFEDVAGYSCLEKVV